MTTTNVMRAAAAGTPKSLLFRHWCVRLTCMLRHLCVARVVHLADYRNLGSAERERFEAQARTTAFFSLFDTI